MEMESPSEWPNPSTVGGCDRRLSRAARRLLETSLRSWLGNDRTSSSDDVWILLEQWLRHAQPSECPLFPSRDCLRYEEEQSIPLHVLEDQWKSALPVTTIRERNKVAKSSSHQSSKHHYHHYQSNRWWKCGICHKVFQSRYYMDLHWHTHHHVHADGDCGSDANHLICPAKDWCRMMGLANCYQQALMDEPYYDRGSSSGGDDHGKFKQHRYAKMAQSIPCQDDEIQRECRTILEACRVTDPTMITNVCATWTCPRPNTLSYLWSSTSSSSSLMFFVPDEWQRIWMSETYGYSYSGLIVGLLVLVAIYAWLYLIMMGPATLPTGRGQKGLVVPHNNNNNRRRKPSSSSRPTTLYDPVPTSWLHPSNVPSQRPIIPPPGWHKEE